MIGKPVTVITARWEDYVRVNEVAAAVWGWAYDDSTIIDHIQRFPQGTFLALAEGEPVGFALTMRTQRAPWEQPLSWDQAIGGLQFRNHIPEGEWLYGVDFGVHPDFRRHGIGTLMYKARFDLAQRLHLQGFYAGGMLRGYDQYRQQMTLDEYGEKVMRGELKDPTVTMQINRGFKPRAVIKNYAYCPPADHGAMLIVWDNPEHRRTRISA